jgi:DNA-binding response OmpR family regulator
VSRILLVEDDIDVLELVAYVLRREHYVVVEAGDGDRALQRWKAERPDLVVLDLGLPRLDGFDVLRRIRAEDQTPILVISGRTEPPNILRAFDLGTDDFLAKPLQLPELSARIRAILRRTEAPASPRAEPRVQLDGLFLDAEAYELTWRDACVRLTPTEFRILYLLVMNAGHVVSTDRLYAYVWRADGGDASALRSHLSRLRDKLEIAGEVVGTIVSAPSVGYIFKRTCGATLSTRSGATVLVKPAHNGVTAQPTAVPGTAVGATVASAINT